MAVAAVVVVVVVPIAVSVVPAHGGDFAAEGGRTHEGVCVGALDEGRADVQGRAVVAVAVGGVGHGAQGDPTLLLLRPLEISVVKLEVFLLYRLAERELLRVTNFWRKT